MTKLRQSARQCPQCMSCGKPNPDGNLLCLAHSNSLSAGRGYAHKAVDATGSILCDDCHKWHDSGTASKEEKMQMFVHAHNRTLIWWMEAGYLR